MLDRPATDRCVDCPPTCRCPCVPLVCAPLGLAKDSTVPLPHVGGSNTVDRQARQIANRCPRRLRGDGSLDPRLEEAEVERAGTGREVGSGLDPASEEEPQGDLPQLRAPPVALVDRGRLTRDRGVSLSLGGEGRRAAASSRRVRCSAPASVRTGAYGSIPTIADAACVGAQCLSWSRSGTRRPGKRLSDEVHPLP
ncbi:Uncharacterised protein [Mycobacteroides abscessus]|nr:Uncharacterised protein [Mycobacteroides abscessus]